MSRTISRMLSLALAAMLALGMFALAGCTPKDDSSNQGTSSQMECFGDDLPVTNG